VIVAILTVCTANLCRSPLLERILQGSLDRVLRAERAIRVVSAGTRARPGEPSPPIVRELVAEHAGDPSAMVATALTADLVQDAELILTATREHRSAVVRLHRRALRTTFTVREFGRLLDGLDLSEPVGLPGLVRAVAGRRGRLPPVPAEADAIADPIGGGRAGYESAVLHMLPVVDALTSALVRTSPR
jgi:protein-tyrosine phosphatase